MSKFAENLLSSVKLTLREASGDFDDEIKDYIDACEKDLKTSGILSSYFPEDPKAEIDPQIKQAVKWYCKGSYGLYNSDMEKYLSAYHSLKATLCTQSVYTEEKNAL